MRGSVGLRGEYRVNLGVNAVQVAATLGYEGFWRAIGHSENMFSCQSTGDEKSTENQPTSTEIRATRSDRIQDAGRSMWEISYKLGYFQTRKACRQKRMQPSDGLHVMWLARQFGVGIPLKPRWKVKSWNIVLKSCYYSSTTSIHLVFITDCQLYSTVHRRWPGFSSRRCSCLEQSASTRHLLILCDCPLVPS